MDIRAQGLRMDQIMMARTICFLVQEFELKDLRRPGMSVS